MAASDQVPTGSNFHGRSEGAEVIAAADLAGKTAIVTGGYSGIGLETVRSLAAKQASSCRQPPSSASSRRTWPTAPTSAY